MAADQEAITRHLLAALRNARAVGRCFDDVECELGCELPQTAIELKLRAELLSEDILRLVTDGAQ